MSFEEESKETTGESVKVETLNPGTRQVNTTVKVSTKNPSREVVSRNDGSVHHVADVLVGDETGSIIMTFWDDAIDKVTEGDTIDVKNGYISLFKGSMRLNTGKYGSFEKTETAIETVNTDNNLSNKQFEQERRFPSFRSSYGGGRRDDRRGGGRYRRRY
jgi:replication factor A1